MMLPLDPNSATPIYLQIADFFEQRILAGTLPPGERLPTEQHLCAELLVARGTVKHAYAELARRCRIETVQGRGTFVAGVRHPAPPQSGQERLSAIQKTLSLLCARGISEQEIVSVIRAEAWSRLTDPEKLRVAWVDCSPELLLPAACQISEFCNVLVTPFCLSQLRSDAGALTSANFDLIATTLPHHEELCVLLPGLSLCRVALSLEGRCVRGLAQLTQAQRVGVLFRSEEFLERVRQSVRQLAPQVELTGIPFPVTRRGDWDAVILPPDCPADEGLCAALSPRPEDVLWILFEYGLDKGSLIHLRGQAQQLWLRRMTAQEPSKSQISSGQSGPI